MIARAITLGTAAVLLVAAGLTFAWWVQLRNYGNTGPTSVLQDDLDAWMSEQAVTEALSTSTVPLITAGLVCAVGAVVVMAARGSRRERSAA